MKITDFKLERYFAKHEFTASHLLLIISSYTSIVHLIKTL